MNQIPRMHASHLRQEICVRDSLDIAAATDATAIARLFFKNTLRAWGATGAIEDMLLVGSELATNAIKECKKAVESAQSWGHPPSKLIRIRLLGFSSTIAVEVWDRCPSEPRLLPVSLERENGRGLLLVESLSVQWGFYPMRPWGKVVWAELPVNVRQAVTA